MSLLNVASDVFGLIVQYVALPSHLHSKIYKQLKIQKQHLLTTTFTSKTISEDWILDHELPWLLLIAQHIAAVHPDNETSYRLIAFYTREYLELEAIQCCYRTVIPRVLNLLCDAHQWRLLFTLMEHVENHKIGTEHIRNCIIQCLHERHVLFDVTIPKKILSNCTTFYQEPRSDARLTHQAAIEFFVSQDIPELKTQLNLNSYFLQHVGLTLTGGNSFVSLLMYIYAKYHDLYTTESAAYWNSMTTWEQWQINMDPQIIRCMRAIRCEWSVEQLAVMKLQLICNNHVKYGNGGVNNIRLNDALVQLLHILPATSAHAYAVPAGSAAAQCQAHSGKIMPFHTLVQYLHVQPCLINPLGLDFAFTPDTGSPVLPFNQLVDWLQWYLHLPSNSHRGGGNGFTIERMYARWLHHNITLQQLQLIADDSTVRVMSNLLLMKQLHRSICTTQEQILRQYVLSAELPQCVPMQIYTVQTHMKSVFHVEREYWQALSQLSIETFIMKYRNDMMTRYTQDELKRFSAWFQKKWRSAVMTFAILLQQQQEANKKQKLEINKKIIGIIAMFRGQEFCEQLIQCKDLTQWMSLQLDPCYHSEIQLTEIEICLL